MRSRTLVAVALLALAGCSVSGMAEDEDRGETSDAGSGGAGPGRELVAAEGKPEGVREGGGSSSSSGSGSSEAGAGGSTSSGSSSTSSAPSPAPQAVTCPGVGYYCGSDGPVPGGDANTLYDCPVAGQAPTSATPCASGCTVEPAGVPDICAGTVMCMGKGEYCGSDGPVPGGDANTLYDCPGAYQPPSSSQACANGCTVKPVGQPDVCNSGIVCPGVGMYCGSDGVPNGDANTLYDCPTAGQPPSSASPCANGCSVQPAGVPDYCLGSCSAAAQGALNWEAGIINAGQAGNCNANPPACYSDWCMEFVYDAYHNGAGIDVAHNATAAGDIPNFQNEGVWNNWYAGAVPPCGAIVVWPANSCSGGDGHIVISNGDGTASTSGWPGYAGGTHASLSWLSQVVCSQPAGWANPP